MQVRNENILTSSDKIIVFEDKIRMDFEKESKIRSVQNVSKRF